MTDVLLCLLLAGSIVGALVVLMRLTGLTRIEGDE